MSRSGWMNGTGHGTGTWPVVVVTMLAVLVPTAFLLWFMNAAVRNERLAVRQRLADAYRERAVEAGRAIEAYWAKKSAALEAAGEAVRMAPPVAFANLVNTGTVDSAVILDKEGHATYPTLEMPAAKPNPDAREWSEARALEYDWKMPGEAAKAFERIAAESTDVEMAARAYQARARCLVEAGRDKEAIAVLTGRLCDRALADARDEHGALIGLNALLLAMDLQAKTDAAKTAKLRETLYYCVEGYEEPFIPAPQRRFLMQAYRETPGAKAGRSKLEAETIAAEYLAAKESDRRRPGVLEDAGNGRWQYLSSDGRVVALFGGERLAAEMATAAGLGEMREGAMVTLAAPGSPEGAEALLRMPASATMPDWRLEVTLAGGDPFAEAARRQVALYLWAGLVGIGAIAVLAFVAARYVAREMRLTRLKNDLIATVSHELKTPLASMRVLVDTLVEGRVEGEGQAREYFGLISRENERLSRLIDNFLTFSRMERNKKTFEQAEVEVDEVVRAAAEAVGDKMSRPGCVLDVEVTNGLPTIIADKDALVTAVVNLLDNAYKYSGEEKRIKLRAYCEDGGVCIAVADNGIGISRRDRRRIFDRFYQVDQSLSRTAGGCGLGLAIVKFIVDAHGGTVGVTSEAGKGSEFTIRLPAAARPQTSESVAQ